MPIVIYGQQETSLSEVSVEGDALWLKLADLDLATGWEVKPEGVCRDEECIPIPPAETDSFVRDDSFNLSRFARHIGQPIVHDKSHDAWVFGEPAGPDAPTPLTAPDFTLPDFEGREHSLSDYRGNKVFLATWASW